MKSNTPEGKTLLEILHNNPQTTYSPIFKEKYEKLGEQVKESLHHRSERYLQPIQRLLGARTRRIHRTGR
jgi:hypothetical protein